jgi:hypothetical protein
MTWWWCLKHNRAEPDDQVDTKGDLRLGPYPTEERAQNWKQEYEARNERFDREDAAWREQGRRPDEIDQG